MNSTSTSRRRRRLMFWGILLIGIPVLTLLLLEGALRLFGYGYDGDFTAVREVDGRAVRVPNGKFACRFFPPEIARAPVPFAYPVEKKEGTLRIFVLGASAAQGDPEPAYGLSRVLEVLLADRHPTVAFEVINTAIVATNSHVVREIAEEVAAHDADLLLVYLGNNEVIGPFGLANRRTPFTDSLPGIRARLALSRFRVPQLAGSIARALGPGDGAPTVWGGMQEFLDYEIPRDDPRLESIYSHFRKNLGAICAAGRRHGVPVVLSTVAVNLADSAPFASRHRDDLTEADRGEWDGLVERGAAREAAGDVPAALEQYRAAERIDDGYADLEYRIGRCCRALGRREAALLAYENAVDLDTLRFRADRRINAVIREVAAAREGVSLVDAAADFRDADPETLPGRDWFLEHVHFTLEGTVQLAESLLPAVEQALALNRDRLMEGPAAGDVRHVADRLAFTEFDRALILRELSSRLVRPPFRNQSDAEARTEREQRRLARTVAGIDAAALDRIETTYGAAIHRRPKDVWLRLRHGNFLLRGRGSPRDAETEFRRVVELGLDNASVRTLIGLALYRQNELEEASDELHHALRLDPRFPDAHDTLGLVRAASGDLVAAEESFRAALEYHPSHAGAHTNLGLLLLQRGALPPAEEHLREALAANPWSSEAHAALAATLEARQSLAEALVHYEAARRFDPGDLSSAARLAWLLATSPMPGTRNGPRAVAIAEDLAQATNHRNARVLDVLAAAYAEAGKFEKAVRTVESALALVGSNEDARRALAQRLALYRDGRAYRSS